jgi:rSAM/selenodomain-associated transferase 2
MSPGALVSVIIPALDEKPRIERALGSTRAPGVERIVVDGGSRDGTAGAARALGAERVVESPPGRSRQLAHGVELAQGDVLLFLHADSRLEPGWVEELRRALSDPRVAGGAFRLRFESPRLAYRALELGVRLRTRLGGLPYGDQALFARRCVLDRSGALAPTPIFEDLDLARRIRRHGRLRLLRSRAFTSPRRYERNGILRVVARNQLALGAFWLGLDRDRVARWYHGRPRD